MPDGRASPVTDRAGDPAALAGAGAGIAALAAFLALHHLWIAPIWMIAPAGIGIGALGGAAVGVAYRALRPRLPGRPWRSAAVFGLFAVVLAPALVFAQATGPIFAMGPGGGGVFLVSGTAVLVDVLVGLVLAPAAAGAVVGWVIGRSRRPAGLMAVAAVALALGPGHNIPFLGATPAVGRELVLLGAMLAVGSVTLVELDHRLVARGGPRC